MSFEKTLIGVGQKILADAGKKNLANIDRKIDSTNVSQKNSLDWRQLTNIPGIL